ncbi:MAG: DUF4411 family protein [Thermomicrobiales bacterium]
MYLLDANVFIEAKNRHFGFDIAPGFWEWLELRHQAGTVYSVEAVRDELLRGNDMLAAWTETLDPAFFIAPDGSAFPHMATLSQWASTGHFTQSAIDDFLASADYKLAAQAKGAGFTVVTHEIANPASRRRIMLPDACAELGVPAIGAYAFMHREGLRLILDPSLKLAR